MSLHSDTAMILDAIVEVEPVPPAIAWLRDERFHGDEEAALAFTRTLAALPDPTMAQLVANVERYGPTGVLESATHLTEAQFAQLAVIVHKASRDPRHTDRPRRRKRRS